MNSRDKRRRAKIKKESTPSIPVPKMKFATSLGAHYSSPAPTPELSLTPAPFSNLGRDSDALPTYKGPNQ